MLNMKTSVATLLFRLPADKISDSNNARTENSKSSFRLGNTLYVTYEEFLEATGLASAEPIPE